jgi:hypothetical protein
MRLNIPYINRVSGEIIYPVSAENLGGVLAITYHRVSRGEGPELEIVRGLMQLFIAADDFSSTYIRFDSEFLADPPRR